MVLWIKVLNHFNGLVDQNTNQFKGLVDKMLNQFNGLLEKNGLVDKNTKRL